MYTHTLRHLTAFFLSFSLSFFSSLSYSLIHANMNTHMHMLVDVASATLRFVLHKLGLPRGEGSRLAMTA